MDNATRFHINEIKSQVYTDNRVSNTHIGKPKKKHFAIELNKLMVKLYTISLRFYNVPADVLLFLMSFIC